jgi:hypothetical protein
MTTELLFCLQLVLGYAVWLLCLGGFVLPHLRKMDRPAAQRLIAALHSFRFFGLVFILPGVIGPRLPQTFGTYAAYGDLATALLAMAALAAFPIKPLFHLLVLAFNLVGMADIGIDYYHATMENLPAVAGSLGGAYAVPVLYVPLLMITHILSLYWLFASAAKPDRRPASS